ncbi:hypothetical protein PAECIP111893_01506 [Paenibacillus plantiphilus]|uniref:Uncharacterized protein n=2 Tax=Paenibacillus plantiphilus TaxID=2905650 RepID=A0ABM9C302_9BACL|nr:hypothetical protein PAECIP111893_01506 [Paenibacillus plantiphilus]
MNSLIYITVYTLEAFCTITASYMLFRFHFKEFIWKKLMLSLLLAVFSYSMRDITIVNIYTILVPSTYLLAYTLFITFVSKIRVVWASIMMSTGYALLGTVQMSLLLLFDTLGVDMAAVQGNLFFLVLAQVMTAIVMFTFLFLYYYRGRGFVFDFPSWRWKHLWLVMLEVILIALILQFIYVNKLTMIIAAVVTLTALLLLSNKMEKEEGL